MAEQARTCGQGMAQHAAAPRTIAEMLDALGETLELHRSMLILDDPNSRKGDEVYRELAVSYRQLAAKLADTAERMAAQRELPMGRHDETKWGAAHLRAFTRFVKAQNALAARLRSDAPRDQKMLAEMTGAPALKPAVAAFNRLLGTWKLEATHPAMPGVVVSGTAVIEWLEGEQFLIQRSLTDH